MSDLQDLSFRRRTFPLTGGHMAGTEFGPEDTPIRIVFLHANGFNGLTYSSLLAPLGVRSLALDLRGYGQSDLPTDRNTLAGFKSFAKDVACVLDQLPEEQIILAGHSMGATTALYVNAMRPEKVKTLVAFEPVVLPVFMRMMAKTRWGRARVRDNFVLAKMAQRRREVFESKATVIERYRGRGAFKGVSDQVLADYVEDGFNRQADGTVKLAADRMWEATAYSAQASNPWPALKRLPAGSQIHFVTSRDSASTDLGRRRVSWMRHLDVSIHTDMGHFFPLTHLDFAMRCLEKSLQR